MSSLFRGKLPRTRENKVADDLESQITSEAAKPQSQSADGVSESRRSLQDLIAADKYLAGKAAMSSTTPGVLGIKFNQIVSPGAGR